jgi:hypothetical protein
MPLPIKEDGYSWLTVNYKDIDSDSDTTLGSADLHGKRTKRRKRQCHQTQSALTWFRWASVVTLQSIILILIVLKMSHKEDWRKSDTETGGDVNGLYIPSAYNSNPKLSRADLSFSIPQVHSSPAGGDRVLSEYVLECEQDGDPEELGCSHASG